VVPSELLGLEPSLSAGLNEEKKKVGKKQPEK
jgi:hypothetical protein